MKRDDALDAMLENFVTTQQEYYKLVLGKTTKQVPIFLPVRLRAEDVTGDVTYLGHYILYEMPLNELRKIFR